jgi:hypothetical protein
MPRRHRHALRAERAGEENPERRLQGAKGVLLPDDVSRGQKKMEGARAREGLRRPERAIRGNQQQSAGAAEVEAADHNLLQRQGPDNEIRFSDGLESGPIFRNKRVNAKQGDPDSRGHAAGQSDPDHPRFRPRDGLHLPGRPRERDRAGRDDDPDVPVAGRERGDPDQGPNRQAGPVGAVVPLPGPAGDLRGRGLQADNHEGLGLREQGAGRLQGPAVREEEPLLQEAARGAQGKNRRGLEAPARLQGLRKQPHRQEQGAGLEAALGLEPVLGQHQIGQPALRHFDGHFRLDELEAREEAGLRQKQVDSGKGEFGAVFDRGRQKLRRHANFLHRVQSRFENCG